MSAIPVSSCVLPPVSQHLASQQANAWIARYHEELVSRAGACFHHLPEVHREEMVAEIVARALAWAFSAARRGRLNRLTAYWVVTFAARKLRVGRRFAGDNSSCVMSEAARLRHGVRVTSLDAQISRGQNKPVCLRECLADRDAENPYDVVRRENDYPAIFEMESVSPKAVATFQYLADTKSEGKQCELAMDLGVSPGRVTQLKGEVGVALSRHGYGRPPGRRRSSRPVECVMA